MRPFMVLAERLGALVAQLARRPHPTSIGIRYYGPLVERQRRPARPAPWSPACFGRCCRRASRSSTPARSRTSAASRSSNRSSSRPRDFANLLSVKLQTSEGERWIEGTVFEPGSPRLSMLDGVDVEAPLDGRRSSSCRTTTSPASSATSARCSASHGINIAQLRARPRRERRGRRRHAGLGRGRGAAAGGSCRKSAALPAVRSARLATITPRS